MAQVEDASPRENGELNDPLIYVRQVFIMSFPGGKRHPPTDRAIRCVSSLRKLIVHFFMFDYRPGR